MGHKAPKCKFVATVKNSDIMSMLLLRENLTKVHVQNTVDAISQEITEIKQRLKKQR